ncbi:MAG: LrgB family protein [Bacteroidales bacterium]|nr:LrgB family protein [Bacteroidales bacterium]
MEPKSVTAPIAIELSNINGGISAITVVSVTICGMLGASIGPAILNLCKIKNPIARGSAMGCASHGIGTSRALEESAIEGAVSGLCIALMGVATSVLMPIFNRIAGI